jgi:sirohydrochlorin ferrochelatase
VTPRAGSALLAVVHGSRDSRAAQSTEALLAAVSRLRPELPMAAGYLDFSSPDVQGALDRLVAGGATEVVAVPMLLTPGFHSTFDVPRELEVAAERHPELRVRAGAVLGPDPLLLDALERRLAEVGVRPHPDTAVVLAASGTSNPAGLAVIKGLADTWRVRSGWRDVLPAYAAATGPTVAEAVAELRAAGAPRVAVASYVLAPGRLPDRMVAVRAPDVPVSEPLGDAPELAAVVLARYDAARGAGAVVTPS